MSKNNDAPVLSIKSEWTDRFIRLLAAHPYMWALVVCLGLNPFYFGSEKFVPPFVPYFEVLLLLAAGMGIIYYLFRNNRLDKFKALSAAVIYLVLLCFASHFYFRSPNIGIWKFAIGFIILVLLYYFAETEKFRDQLNSMLILSTGFLLKLLYVFYTAHDVRQHDVHSFGGEKGHAGYIEYLLFNHKLPDFDVREVWQFSHPPLHHFISAVWIGINEFILGVGHDPARESIQTLTLFYSMTIMISAYRIFRHFKLEGLSMYIPLAIVCFHPTFILFSGSINNDVLSVAFMMGAFSCTLKWYEDQKLSHIIKIAVCVGLGMMTKLSAAIIAPSIAIVFLIVFIKKIKTDGVKLFGQFAAFGAICIPLGLWFGIRNYINYKIPLTYVQQMPVTSVQYIGDQNFLKRITDFSSYQFKNVFEQWLYYDENSYDEFNPLVALLKNSVFGEAIYEGTFGNSPLYLTFAELLFWIAAFIAAICFVMMIYNICTKSGLDPTMKVFWGSFYFALMFSFYKLAKDYPFVCTMNFRYITPTVIIGAFFAGVTVKRLRSSKKDDAAIAVNILGALTVIFCFLSTIVYILVCVLK